MKRSLVRASVFVTLCAAALAPATAHASVVFSQPPSGETLAWVSSPQSHLVAPFLAASPTAMTGLSFWAYNFNITDTIRVEFFAEAPGGGLGATLFNSVFATGSFVEESAFHPAVSKYTLTLGAPITLDQGARYFLGVSSFEVWIPEGPFFGWVVAGAGEAFWASVNGQPHIEWIANTPLAFEILGDPIVIPLPSGAAMGLAGLGMMFGLRRRRAAV